MQDVIGTTGITVRPLSAACGAEIGGVDLSQTLPDDTIRAIKAAWDEHLVIVFRGQTFTQEQQLAFAARFGQVGQRRQAPQALAARVTGTEQTDNRVLLVTNMKDEKGKPIGAFGDGEMWFHIDSGYAEKPYLYTFLYGVTLPSRGGNTMFANLYKAYEALPADLRAKLAGRKALHIHEYKRHSRAEVPDDLSGVPHYFHPVFARHPSTGRTTLFVDRLMTQRIEGLSHQESEEILQILYELGERKEHVYEHEWRLGDVVCWDNRATMHARTWFPEHEPRLMRRCTVEGGKVVE